MTGSAIKQNKTELRRQHGAGEETEWNICLQTQNSHWRYSSCGDMISIIYMELNEPCKDNW